MRSIRFQNDLFYRSDEQYAVQLRRLSEAQGLDWNIFVPKCGEGLYPLKGHSYRLKTQRV